MVRQESCAMKVCTDACLFGAWIAEQMQGLELNTADILDIGTGTGLLSLMLAQKTPAFIDAIETDRQAYEQAKLNVEGSNWKNRIQVIHGDVKTYTLQKKYGLIISNPPFYEHDLVSPLEADNVARHSQLLTLHQLLEVATAHLAETGHLAVLLPYYRSAYFQTIAMTFDLNMRAELLVRHSPLHPFFRSCLLFSSLPSKESIREELAIKEGNNYTAPFSRLLHDYYLHF